MAKNAEYLVRVSTDLSTFGFTSVSDNKVIEKRVEYTDTKIILDDKPIYNLGFGDVDKNGNIDDEAESNNGDIVKVISAVSLTIYEYTAKYPNRYIYFRGSNTQRTEFYQTLLKRKHNELVEDFDIFGVKGFNEEEIEFEEFRIHETYTGFMVIRKLNEGLKFD